MSPSLAAPATWRAQPTEMATPKVKQAPNQICQSQKARRGSSHAKRGRQLLYLRRRPTCKSALTGDDVRPTETTKWILNLLKVCRQDDDDDDDVECVYLASRAKY